MATTGIVVSVHDGDTLTVLDQAALALRAFFAGAGRAGRVDGFTSAASTVFGPACWTFANSMPEMPNAAPGN
jgi:hypothetical protein